MTAVVLKLVPNPWVCCDACGDEVHSRTGGRNAPCGCVASATSACPPWDPVVDCPCGNRDAADALQEALETGDAAVLAERRVAAMIEQAERWRPNLWSWLMFAALVLLIAGALTTLGTGQ